MRPARLDSLQVLRALAAALVTVHHLYLTRTVFGYPDAAVLPWLADLFEFAKIGVDVFFVISGFVIALMVAGGWEKSRRDFFLKRVARIYPLYYMALALVVAFGVLKGKAMGLSSGVWLNNLTLFPWGTTGQEPVLPQAWSLYFEMFFYFWAVVVWKRRFVSTISLLLGLFVALGGWGGWRFEEGGALHLAVNPMLLEFLAGCWIYHFWSQGRWRTLSFLGTVLALAWIAVWCGSGGRGGIGFAAVVAGKPGWDRVFFLGIPAALFVMGVIALEEKIKWPRWLLVLGDASYALYILNFILIGRTLGLLSACHIPYAVAMPLGLVIVASFSWVAFAAIDRPLWNAAKRVLVPKRAEINPAPATSLRTRR